MAEKCGLVPWPPPPVPGLDRLDNCRTPRVYQPKHFIYSVMHPNRNSFCGDVVLDSFNMASRDENRMLDQTFKKQI